MTAKAFLARARNIDRRIDETLERMERIRARLEAGRMSAITGMPRGGAQDWTDTADRVIELEKRMNAQVREMVRLKQAAMDAIEGVADSRLREVLELRYLSGLSWEGVAERMHMDLRWVYRLHGRALMEVRVPEAFDH